MPVPVATKVVPISLSGAPINVKSVVPTVRIEYVLPETILVANVGSYSL